MPDAATRLTARSATAFSLAVLCAFPLCIDHFSNLGVVKYTSGFTLFLAFGVWFAACWLVGARAAAGRFAAARRDVTLWALAAFAAATLLSTLTSLSPVASLWGLGSYYGGLTLVLYTAAGYLAVRAFAAPGDLPGLLAGMGLTAAVVTVLYTLNIFNIDLIGAYADTAVVERAQFFSTLGQKDFNAGCLALLLPPVFYAFLTAHGRKVLLYVPGTVFGALALAVVDAEGLMLGVGAAGLMLICQRGFGTRQLRRLALLGAAFFAWAGLMTHLRATVYTQGGTPLLAALGRAGLPGALLCLALWAALFFYKKDVPLYIAGRILTAVTLVCLTALLMLANLWPGFPSLGALDGLLVFNDDWGTYRGTGWRAAWGAWAAGSAGRKLVGFGPGMMHSAVADWAGSAMTPLMATFYAAHNEYLEQLLSTGLLGLAAWLAFLVSHLRRAARAWTRPGVLPLTLGLVSYLAQAVVSIRVSMVFPLVMLLFGWLAALTAPDGGQKGGEPPAAAGRQWLGAALAAAVSMAVCSAAARLLFGFLYA